MNSETGILAIIIMSIFTDNILLTKYLGMCPFLGASREIKTSLGLGTAVTMVLGFTTPLNYLFYKLLEKYDVGYLRFIVFIIVIAAFVQVTEIVVERVSEKLYNALGIFLPLITVNCAILGVSLFMVIQELTFWQTVVYGFSSGIGWTMAIVAMAGIRTKMAKSRVPKPLAGAGIALIIGGIMAIAFMGFMGMLAS